MADVLQAFHPAVAQWFRATLGAPSAPQQEGWPLIQSGRHVLIAAPTGSGKTLAAFLSAINRLLTEPGEGTRVLYISPLRALANDVQKNLLTPIEGIRALDPSLPEIDVFVRSGDTPARERARMAQRPPQVLVTTPESLYILLTSASGRRMRSTPCSGTSGDRIWPCRWSASTRWRDRVSGLV
jgi:ATP-dependent Lhr-like helicase